MAEKHHPELKDVAEACLQHKKAGRMVSSRHARHDFAKERAALLREWADRVAGVTIHQRRLAAGSAQLADIPGDWR
jgi:hypothetical protein